MNNDKTDKELLGMIRATASQQELDEWIDRLWEMLEKGKTEPESADRPRQTTISPMGRYDPETPLS